MRTRSFATLGARAVRLPRLALLRVAKEQHGEPLPSGTIVIGDGIANCQDQVTLGPSALNPRSACHPVSAALPALHDEEPGLRRKACFVRLYRRKSANIG
jgi:hypothetical protein